jgi:hypothetical protein
MSEQSDPDGRMVRQTVERYVARTPGMSESYLHDPQQHALIHILKRTLIHVDRAMEGEGLDPAARQRIISTALFGGPDEEAALRRVEETRQQFEGDMRGFGIR